MKVIPVDDICIISIDKSEDVWAVEGEIIYDEDISCPFAVSYSTIDDELLEYTAENDMSDFDMDELTEKIKVAIINYEE